ncbi:type II toxin-antitoxin system VapC family toxin [Sandaracinobacter sp. RS1-74]|uniref:type II toxin-antitoxin system VapC family toxin n=1 Tax=Sandaracinobacteroides sayramensis TaxID=2913411 RepID=UPI001EDC444F|nr:type II toxin-antitoxin system VapC family toxin [Sandaracinobacteroides sayramensis]MCG2840412.1 type II toxin-antitoxin system VapC family toxin [Sandaracinobacteroides sayramensis]
MILVDSTVWVDHLRRGDPLLASRLDAGLVYIHPFIIGEIALGSLRQRDNVLSALRDLPMASQASDDEVQGFIEQQPLYSLGIGYIDAHLLAATRLTPGLRLWTRDKRLNEIASRLGIAKTAQH